MNFFKVVSEDILNVLHNKLLILAVSAIILVPVIYGGIYLAAFWNPYGKTGNIPVIVVNLDKYGVMDNNKVNYGNDIVDNLRGNRDLQWHFSKDLKKSEKDLNNGKYYAMLVIPNDFTDHMVEADKGNLKKPSLIFVTNKKKNYIVGLITDKAATTIQDTVNKNMTYNIGIKMYDSLYQLRDGMESASNGTGQIRDGVMDMKDQVPALKNGTDKLYDGASSLTDNLNSAVQGSNELRDGIGSLNGKMPDLVDAMGKLLKGSSTLTGKIGDAWDGSKSLRDGIGSLGSQIPTLTDGINQLYDGSTSLQDGLHEMDDNMPDLVSGVGKLRDGSKQLKDGLAQVQSGVGTAENTLNDQIEKNKQYILQNVYPRVEQLTKISGEINKAIPDDSNLKIISQNIYDNLLLLQNKLNDLSNTGSIDEDKLIQILDGAISYLQETSDQLGKLINNMDPNNPIYNSCVNLKEQLDYLTGDMQILESGIKDAGQLVSGINQLADGANQLNDGLNELYDKTNELKDGTDTLYNGSRNLRDGIGQLKDSLPQLSNGVNALESGSSDLSDGLYKIHDGSQTLTDGLGELNDSAPELQNGVQQLYDGSTDLSDGLLKLFNGSGTLRDGIKTLKDKIPDLQDGINQLYEGISELHDKLADGAEQLSDKLGPSSKEMGNFLSSPMNIKNHPLYDITGYGQGLAPYFMSLGLWVGALLMFFVITEKVDPNIEVGIKGMVVGKYLSYAVLGVFQAICISVVVMILGLKPSNILIYFLFNIFLSLVFIGIIQNFVFLLGDIGRFVAIFVLILQLTASNGTFPGELLPKFFKIISPFLPFTYSISAMREIDFGINYSVLGKDTAVLFIFLAVSMTSCLLLKKYSLKFNWSSDIRETGIETLEKRSINKEINEKEENKHTA
ncbi:YhgE/Pip family protein [Clostridium sp. Mt-5]|uniref:YhgE/Pip family protein n=1 Tax=Clostridium moutaii TaxID=3240932 RepID=A0ABV4BSS4_9CLOT